MRTLAGSIVFAIPGSNLNAIQQALYMATLSATLCNPVIKEFYQRLTAQGKHNKVALTACMRKFIVILNALVKDNCEWQY